MKTGIRSHRSLLKASLSAALSIGVASSSWAAWDAYPEITAEYGMDDNVRLTPIGEDKAGVGSAEGRLILRNAGETHNVRATLGARHSVYSGTDLKDGTAGTVQLSADKRSERISYGMIGVYQNQPLLRSGAIDLDTGALVGDATSIQLEMLNNPGATQDLDIGFVEEEVRRHFAQVSPYLNFSLSDRSTLRLEGNIYGAAYDSDAELLGLEDYESYGAAVQYRYLTSERNTVQARLSFDTFDPENSEGSDRIDFLAGFSRQVSDRTVVLVEAGVGRAKSDTGREDTVGLYRASVESAFERGHLSVYLSRDNYPTGFGNTVVTDSLTAEWRQALSERLEMRLKGTALKVDSNLDQGATFEDRDYVDIEGRLSYAVTPAWRVGGAYRYRWTDRSVEADTSTGNAVFAFVSYAPPRPF